MYDLKMILKLFGLFTFIFPLTQVEGQSSPYHSGCTFYTIYSEPLKWWAQNANLTTPGFDTLVSETILHIVGVNKACVTIKIPHLNYVNSIVIEKDSIETIVLPDNPRLPYVQPTQNLIYVEANQPITVLQSNNTGNADGGVFLGSDTTLSRSIGAEAMVVLPYEETIKDTCFLLFPSLLENECCASASFAIAAYDSVELEIRPSVDWVYPPYSNNVIYHADSIYNLVLNAGEVWTASAMQWDSIVDRHLYESLILSKIGKKAFEVFLFPEGRVLDSTGSFFSVYNHAIHFTMQKPLKYKGHSFHTPPTEAFGWLLSNSYSLNDQNTINESNSTVTINANERWDFRGGDFVFTSSRGLISYAGYQRNNSGHYMPLSFPLSSDKELIKASTFSTINEELTNNPFSNINAHYLSLVVRTMSRGKVEWNGQLIDSNLFHPYSVDSNWSSASFELFHTPVVGFNYPRGLQTVKCDEGFHGVLYSQLITTPGSSTIKVYPNYAYVLPENIEWDQDTLKARFGLNKETLELFRKETIYLCVGDSMWLTPPAHRHTSWQWDLGDGRQVNQSSNEYAGSAIAVSWTQPGIYQLIVHDLNKCSPGDTLNVFIGEKARAEINYNLDFTCSGVKVRLETPASSGNIQWYTPQSTSTENEFQFIVTGRIDSIPVSLVRTNAYCSDSNYINIRLVDIGSFIDDLPNVITPNGDGQNDALVFDGMEAFDGCYSLSVFNRWGVLIYTTQTVEKPFAGFDLNGRLLSEGVYFYRLSIGEQEKQGEVHIFR